MSKFFSFLPFFISSGKFGGRRRRPATPIILTPPIILTLPTELILDIGEMLDTMSLISLAKAHPLFTMILDDYSNSMIKAKSSSCIRFEPASTSAISPEEEQAYRVHYTSPTRFDYLDSIFAPKQLCMHERSLLTDLVDAGVASSFEDAEHRFSTAVKSVTRYAGIWYKHHTKPWFRGGLRPHADGVFLKVETLLYLENTDKALEKIAAIYSHVADTLKMEDYVASKDAGELPVPTKYERSCCTKIRTWNALMKEVKSDPDYKEAVLT